MANRIELVDLGDGTWTWIVHRDGELIYAAVGNGVDAQAAEAAGRAYFAAYFPHVPYAVVVRPTIDEATIARLTDDAIASAASLVGRAELLIVFARKTQIWELRVGSLANMTTRLGDEQAATIVGASQHAGCGDAHACRENDGTDPRRALPAPVSLRCHASSSRRNGREPARLQRRAPCSAS